MAAGRKQKGYKMVPTDKSISRMIGGGLKKNVPMTPIDKVLTVAKPDCNILVRSIKGPQKVTSKRITIRSGNVCGTEKSIIQRNAVEPVTNPMQGDGTEIINFRDAKFRAKGGIFTK